MREMMIICKDSKTKGIINFYAEDKTGSYFLFQQKFRHSTYEFYKNGVPMSRAFSHKKTHDDKAIACVIKKLPAQIAYAEKEYGIAILNKSKIWQNAA